MTEEVRAATDERTGQLRARGMTLAHIEKEDTMICVPRWTGSKQDSEALLELRDSGLQYPWRLRMINFK